jgi:FlaA1/EpsC-like NDP-sugar epimerase
MRRLRTPLLVVVHVAIVVLSFFAACFLRFEFSIPSRELPVLLPGLALLVTVRVFFFHRYHLFSGWWQFVGVRDVLAIGRSATAGTVTFVALVLLSGALQGFPRSVFVLEWLLTIQLLTGSRIAARLVHGFVQRAGRKGRREVVIVGSGPIAKWVIRELSANPSDVTPVGFVGGAGSVARLHGVPRLGSQPDLLRLLREIRVSEVFIALPSDDRSEIRETIRTCRTAGISFRVISSIRDYLIQPRADEALDLEELFEPEEPIDSAAGHELFHGRTVLLVGAGGQMGAALAREIAEAAPRQLLLFDRSESALYYLEVEFLRRRQMLPLTPLIGDMLDEDRLHEVFETHRPDVVVHAAGYTRPELLPGNLEEVVRNNLIGVRNVLDAVDRWAVPRAFFLSLDEERQDRLGCVQRAAEVLLRTRPGRPGAIRAAVRFPSVLGAAGCEVTRIARALQRQLPIEASAADAQVRIATVKGVARLLLEAFAVASDRDVLALETGHTERVTEIARYLAYVFNLPEAPVEIAPMTLEHVHPLETRSETSSPRVVRRSLPTDTPACVTELVRGLPTNARELVRKSAGAARS